METNTRGLGWLRVWGAAGACLLVAGLCSIGTTAPAVEGPPLSGGPSQPDGVVDLMRRITEAAMLPGPLEGYVTQVVVQRPTLGGAPEAGPTKSEFMLAQGEDSRISGLIVSVSKYAFRCQPKYYAVDDVWFQVTPAGPQEPSLRELYWLDPSGAERTFSFDYLADHTAPGSVVVSPRPGRALYLVEDALQVDLGLDPGRVRYWLRRMAEADPHVALGVLRQGLECVQVAYGRSEPAAQEVVEWICPGRGYRCVERVQRTHLAGGRLRYLHMVVDEFLHVAGSLWVPVTSRMATTDVNPDGTTTAISQVVTSCGGVRLVGPEEAARSPLLPNGTIVRDADRRYVLGQDTSELEARLRDGQLPPPLPVPDLEGVWP